MPLKLSVHLQISSMGVKAFWVSETKQWRSKSHMQLLARLSDLLLMIGRNLIEDLWYQ